MNKKLVSQSSVTKNSAAEQNHLSSSRNASASEVPQHQTTRMTRSHAPFAQTFPSANKTRPQNVHKRHGRVTSKKHFAFRNSET